MTPCQILSGGKKWRSGVSNRSDTNVTVSVKPNIGGLRGLNIVPAFAIGGVPATSGVGKGMGVVKNSTETFLTATPFDV